MEGLLQKAMPQAMNGGQPPAPPQPQASPAAMAGEPAGGGDQPNVTGEEQKEYERGMAAVMTMIHKDPKGQRAIIESLDPKNPVGSVAQSASDVIMHIDERIDVSEGIIMPLLEEVVPLIAEIGIKSKKIQISSKQIEQALATAAEMLLDHYGIDEADYQSAAEGVNPEEAAGVYNDTLNAGEGPSDVQQ